MKNVTVFLDSRKPSKNIFIEEIENLATKLKEHELNLVYGGSKVGTMGILANKCMEIGVKTIGIMPKVLSEKEVINNNLDEVYVVEDMHVRKAMLQNMGDVFVTMPGGCGSIEEIFEIITWNQIGIHDKPYCFVNVDGYYDGIKAYLETALEHNFMAKEDFDKIKFFDSVDELFNSNFIN